MVRKNLPLLSSFLRFDRKCSELGPPLIMKAGSAPAINLVVEEISRKKSIIQTTITYSVNQKEEHVSTRHNIILTLMKSGAPFFLIDIIYMIYIDVRYFSVVCLSIYYEKLAVKTKLTTIRHFFAKKLNCCPSDIICNSIALKCQCLKRT